MKKRLPSESATGGNWAIAGDGKKKQNNKVLIIKTVCLFKSCKIPKTGSSVSGNTDTEKVV
jgi:hypothetical protein